MEDKKTDKNTVFVGGVSFDVGDQEINDFFSDVGPVRQAFIVKSRGGAKHKGYGFVQFALQTDAEKAAVELNGKELGGRKLQVEVAIKRAPLEERKKKRKQEVENTASQDVAGQEEGMAAEAELNEDNPPVKKAKSVKQTSAGSRPGGRALEQLGKSVEKHRMLQAVAVGCLTPDTLSAGLELARSAGEVEEVISPVPQPLMEQYKLERDGCSGTSFIAIFKSVKEAVGAVAKIHGQGLGSTPTGSDGKGKKKPKRKGTSGDEAQGEGGAAHPAVPAVTAWARQVSGEGLHLKRWRLIVRNLPFKVIEAELREAFKPAGFIWEVTLPLSPDGRPRGFAFLGFTCRAHAERGIKLVNAQQVAGRPVAVDWALSKNQMMAAANAGAEEEAGGRQNAERGEAGDFDDSEGEEDGQEGRRLKQKSHKQIVGHESEGEDAEVAPEQERTILHSVIDNILGGGKDAGATGKAAAGKLHPGAPSADEGVAGGEEGEGRGAAGAAADDMFSKKALTERSVAQRAALDRLDRKLQAKPLGKATGAGEGEGQRTAPEGGDERQQGATVFLRGLPLDVTKQQVLSKLQAFGKVLSCRLVVDKESGRLKGTAFADYAEAEAAVKAADACEKSRRKEGPGVVVAGRTVDLDLALGQEAVRNLAVQKAGERGPKDKRNMYLAKEGTIGEGSAAWEEMSQQDRNKRKRAAVEKKTKLASPNFMVSTTRLSVRNIPHTWTEKQLKELFTKAVIERASKARPHIKQSKILLEENTGGVPRSKGIGFVEFDNHEHALCALRQLNNNPKAWGKERRPIIEFAIENAKILKAREAKLARSQQAQQQQQQGKEGQQQPEEPPAKRAKGMKQGSTQPPQHEEVEGEGQEQQPNGVGDGGDGHAEGSEAQQAQQQSKRQRRREIKLKLRAVKQQKAQEAAAAAALAAQQKKAGGGKGAVQEGEGTGVDTAESSRHSKARKRRELRKAKKLGGEAAAGVEAAVAAALTAPVAGKHPSQKSSPAQQSRGRQGGKQPMQGRAGAEGQLSRRQRQQSMQEGQQMKQRQGPNSRMTRAAQQAQHEQQTKQRKRRVDDELDNLVAGMTGGPKQRKQQKKKEGGDCLDQLAAEYRAKFFDGVKAPKGGGRNGKGVQTPAAQLGLKRWFE